MFEFIDWAETFLHTLDELGGFLLTKPFEGLLMGNGIFYDTLLPSWMFEWVYEYFAGVSYAHIVIGLGLLGVLSFKYTKFILDIFF